MRELTQRELEQVDGGNLITWTFGASQVYGAYQIGTGIGEQINAFNRRQSNMSLGEALYRTFN